MRFMQVLSVFVGIIMIQSALFGNDTELSGTPERLSTTEEKIARLAIYSEGVSTTGSGSENPFRRSLVVPKGLVNLFSAKPKATIQLLLAIAEGGRAVDSIHAVCCIEALIKNPEFAAILAQESNPDKWDDTIGGANPKTFRRHALQVCRKLIEESAKKE